MSKSMWRKHRSTFQDHLSYIHNDIAKSFMLDIIQHANRIYGMLYIDKFTPQPLNNGDEYDIED